MDCLRGVKSPKPDYWTLSRSNVYALSDQGGHFSLQRIDLETGRTQTVHVLEHDATPFAGISIAPNGKLIVFAELARASSGLTLVEALPIKAVKLPLGKTSAILRPRDCDFPCMINHANSADLLHASYISVYPGSFCPKHATH